MDRSTTIHRLGEALGEVCATRSPWRSTRPRSASARSPRPVASTTSAPVRSSPPRSPPCPTTMPRDGLRVRGLLDRSTWPRRYTASLRCASASAACTGPRRRVDPPGGELAASGTTPARMAELLRALRVELVLTAHPTEANVAPCCRSSSGSPPALRELADPGLLPRDSQALEAALRAKSSSCGSPTARARPGRGDRRGAHRPLLRRRRLLDTVPRVLDALDAALREHYPRWPRGRLAHAGLVYRRDRDGNPPYRRRDRRDLASPPRPRGRAAPPPLQELARRLSVSGRRLPAADLARRLGCKPGAAAGARRLPGGALCPGPYRWRWALLAADLDVASQDDMTSALLEDTPHERAHGR